MKYRHFKAGNKDLSLLGFGTMRLPMNQDKTINEKEAINLIRHGIDKGINYIDTAYMYHRGKSEGLVGKALEDSYREKVFLVDKFPVWVSKGKDDNRRVFNKQMDRLGMDGVDLYLLHSLNRENWELVKKYEAIDFLEQLKAEGKIKHIGFSFHDNLELFKEIIDSYPWDCCQIQLNFMDKDFQAGVKGLKYAASKGIPVIIMEPLKGGKLTAKVPDQISKIWTNSNIVRTPAEWAFKWIGNFPEVMTVLSGMSNKEQLNENLEIFDSIEANSLTDKEHELINTVSDKYNQMIKYSCTGCQYCLPCPSGINIPKIMDLVNDYYLYEGSDKVYDDYKMWVSPLADSSKCVQCKKCEDICPQSLKITHLMKEATQLFVK
ncbi:MAG: aldo/keto reductase [Anaerovoracaceae bacterium]